jgi:hypothetical protein
MRPIKEYKNDKGELHREDGPAIIWTDGSQFWYINGQLHREDGPAVIYADGMQFWFLDGMQYTESRYYKELYKMGKITEGEMFLKLL